MRLWPLWMILTRTLEKRRMQPYALLMRTSARATRAFAQLLMISLTSSPEGHELQRKVHGFDG